MLPIYNDVASVICFVKLKLLEAIVLKFCTPIVFVFIASSLATHAVSQDLSGWSDKTVCRLSLSQQGDLQYLQEAKKRGLSCGSELARIPSSTTKINSSSTDHGLKVLDEHKNESSPSKKQCNNLFKDQVVVNNIQHYINLHADADFDVKNNRLYSFVSKSGSVARNGPFSLWLYNELYQIATKFRPKNFAKVDGQEIDWKDYENFENALCNAHLGSGTIREVLISSSVLWGRGKEWSGFAGSWESFPYIKTGRKVIKSPSPRGLSHYKKYIAAGGVIIVGGSDVPDGAFYSSYDAVMYLTSEWPGVREKLKQNEARISLFYGPDSNTSVLPEYSNEEEPGGFSMGLTDTSMTANASWVCFPGNWDTGGNPVIHELVHSLNHIVFETTNETYFYERINDLALSAIERGIYGDFEQHLKDGEEQDISHLVGEYWATAVEGYIMNRGPRFKNSHYSREWIKENDPKVYELIRRYYPKADWTYCPGVENHM